MTEVVKASSLVLDFALYPRNEVDAVNVRDLKVALGAGRRLPPVLADRESRRVIDGFHRVRAVLSLHGEEADIVVDWKRYESDQDMLLDAMKLNSGHGRKLSPYDKARCLVLGEEMKLEPEVIATALGMTVEEASRIRLRKVAVGPGNKSVPIKATLAHFAGKKLTDRQVSGNRRAGGMKVLFYVNQVINALDSDLVDERNVNLTAGLRELHEKLDSRLGSLSKAA